MASNLARSRPPSASPNSHNYGHQVHLQTRSITASKYIFKERRRVYGDSGVTKVQTVMGRTYSADPGVDSHHLISILSYDTMKIHYFSQPFGLTRSVRNIMDPRNCVGSSPLGSIITSHPIPMLLDPELLFLMSSLWISRGVRRSVYSGLSAV